jgi:hypothetical protein
VTPRYVIVMEAADSRTEQDLDCDDEVHALVTARRMFVEALVTDRTRPLSVVLGRHQPDGAVDWLNGWRSCS